MYQNSAPFHVLNGIYRVWVTLTPPPPVSSTSKKPSGGRVKIMKIPIISLKKDFLGNRFFSSCRRFQKPIFWVAVLDYPVYVLQVT